MNAGAEAREMACPMCASKSARLRFRDDPHALFDCAECDLTYVSPRVPEGDLIEDVYGESYWRSTEPRNGGYEDYRADADLYRRTFARRWKGLERHFPATGRALEIGCAAGYFLEELLGRGWDVLGIEPSAPMAATARKRLGANRILQATLAQSELAARDFDLIVLWDVLEHLPDPVEALRKARSALRPGGKLIVETQNIRAPFARLTGRRWHHFKHREHLVHFHRATLRECFERANLRVLEMSARGAGKYVRGEFIVERSQRLHRSLPRILRPLLGGSWSVYVNLGDELIAVAEADS